MARQSRISVPNVDALLDPTYACAEVRRVFTPQLETARAMADYGSQLFKRAFFTRERTKIDDLIVIGALFRHFLSCFDGCVLCLESGAVGSAEIIARAQFEAWLYMCWMLNGDRARWARQYLVYDLRQEREWNVKLVRGDEANIQHMQEWRETFGTEHEVPDSIVERAGDRVRAIDRFLARPPYDQINDWFHAAKRKSRPLDWYKVGPNAPSSLADMAKRLGHGANYRIIYRQLSYKTHSSRSSGALKIGSEGAIVEPVRHLGDFEFAFTVTTQLALMTFRLVLTEFRHEELDRFGRGYLERWRASLRVPDVTIDTHLIRV